MGRNLVVCCDGTANQVVVGDDTNVVRLAAVATKDPDSQLVYYGPGLGTMEAEGALTWFGRLATRIAGLAFGYGIARDIRNAYAFIMAHYQPGDRLYLFGFSRGAYTARAVASLLKLYGLLRVGNEALVPYIVRELLHFDSVLLQWFAPAANKRRVDAKFAKARSIREIFGSLDCKPHFVGVWDTVSSVGWFFSPTRIPYTARNADIAIGRHALALDERRAFFIRNLWQFDPRELAEGPHDIKEVWFAGVHCDIGGGYPEAEAGLAKISFEWMVREAMDHGLQVDAGSLQRELGGQVKPARSKPDPNAKMHSSMTWLWALAEFVPVVSGLRGRIRVNLFRRRFVPVGSLIHPSALERRGYAAKLPYVEFVTQILVELDGRARQVLLPTEPGLLRVESHIPESVRRRTEDSLQPSPEIRPTWPARHIHQTSALLQADGTYVEERSGYLLGQSVCLRVFIGPRREGGVAASSPFPERELPPDHEWHLEVLFYEPRQLDGPLLDRVTLPQDGDSNEAVFYFTPREVGPFEGRISVMHAGRVLQTVLLRTRVATDRNTLGDDEGIRLEQAIHVRHEWLDLDKRHPFDATVVFNHTRTGDPVATGLTKGTAWAKSLKGIEEPVLRINEIISKVALTTKKYKNGLDKGENPRLLVELAHVGYDIYSALYMDQLRKLTSEGFDPGDDRITYLQIISTLADAVVPLEFMYDFNPPDLGSSVCPRYSDALESGSCPKDCPRSKKPRGYVCPLGFWGLRKVIERHAYDVTHEVPEAAQLVVKAEAVDGRNRLDISVGALLAHSSRVKRTEVTKVVSSLNATIARNWEAWRTAVGAKRPGLLVAFPHNDGKAQEVRLEIGGTELLTIGLSRDYVSSVEGRAPLVFLLGCDTAGTAQEFSRHIRYFRQAGAAVVVSTVATAFGVHAVRVGETIIEKLLEQDRSRPRSIGEAIRDAKRAALLESRPMALCVVAFGDADWQL